MDCSQRVYDHLKEQVGLLVLYVNELVRKHPSECKCFMI